MSYKMPKKPIDYSKTIIYKLVCNDINVTDIYVGHTTNFTKRKNCHKERCTNSTSKYYNLLVYRFIRNHYGWNNWSMIEIEKYSYADKLEARKRERYYEELLKATLNGNKPYKTNEEHKEYRCQYYKNNFELMKIYQKQYYIENKEHKKHYDSMYRENNREKLHQKFECECGGCYIYKHKWNHLKSKRHQNYINSLVEEPVVERKIPMSTKKIAPFGVNYHHKAIWSSTH